jgi:hypothetical protein
MENMKEFKKKFWKIIKIRIRMRNYELWIMNYTKVSLY